MTIYVHELIGCAPQPLAHYLKALAVLRLLHEQADPDTRAAWRGEHLLLATRLDRAALLRFFLEDWAPTPLVDPWNGGSGFYPKDKFARTEGIEPIAASAVARLEPYRQAIADAQRRTRGWTERPAGAAKIALLAACRNEWSPEPLAFFRSAVVRTGEDAAYPALFGTGGNDGRLDYCANFMKRLLELIDPATGLARPGAAPLLASALLGNPVDRLADSAVGQFLPGGAGGANASDGFHGGALVNAWDFVLMLEGGVGIPVAAVRALDADELPQAAAPFAFQAVAAGYSSAVRSEESARGEQWMPMWSGLASWPEVVALFREGRMALGARKARRALDAARAICRGGSARGIAAFQRYAFIERNGQSNLAVPVGRFEVQDVPEIGLLDAIAGWVDELHRASREAPASVGQDVRRIQDAMMDLCREGGRPERWQELLVALARAENGLIRRPRHTAEARLRPIPPLDPQWVQVAADGFPELRLAAALASQGWPGRFDPHASIRSHCVPIDPRRPDRFDTAGDRLADPARVVWRGRDLVEDLIAVLERRVIEGTEEGADGLPLDGRITAGLEDVAAFLLGDVDDVRLGLLARALMAVRWGPSSHDPAIRDALRPSAATGLRVPAPWAALRLMYTPAGRSGDRPVVLDPQPLALLRAGRVDAAVEAASRRLAMSNVRPKARTAVGSPALARRYAAALAFPLSERSYGRLLAIAARIPESEDPSRNQE